MNGIHNYYLISVTLLLISCILSAFELISVPNSFINFVFPSTKVKNRIRVWRLSNIGQLLLSFLALYTLYSKLEWAFIGIMILLALLNLYIYTIRKVGKDGSDQLRILALLTTCLCFGADKSMGEAIVLCFLGAQLVIGYSTSGIVKLSSPYWRGGLVLAEVLGTYSYGIAPVGAFLKKYPMLEKTCSYGAIASMLSVPVCFFIPNIGFLYLSLAVMLLFHFMTSLLMGLNDFLFTFPLAYPGIIVLHRLIF